MRSDNSFAMPGQIVHIVAIYWQKFCSMCLLMKTKIEWMQNFYACPDAYLMGLSQTVISKDSGGNNMKNQVLIQYIKRILLCWLKQFILMLTSDLAICLILMIMHHDTSDST